MKSTTFLVSFLLGLLGWCAALPAKAVQGRPIPISHHDAGSEGETSAARINARSDQPDAYSTKPTIRLAGNAS